jgi:hypothetical protein
MTADPAARLAELALRRRELLERQELLAAAPRPLPEARAAIVALVAAAAGKVSPPVGYLAHPGEGGGQGVVDSLRRLVSGTIPGAPGPFELMCAVAGDGVTAWLSGELARHYANLPKPLSAAQRAAAEAEITAELATVDRAAAAAWWAALDQGLELPPPEATIEAILGLT